jgi:hypothetical protein
MIMTPPTALSRFVDAYRASPYLFGLGNCHLTQEDEHMLDRLKASKSAQSAFSHLRLDDDKGVKLVAACVWAGRIVKGGHEKEVETFRLALDPETARAALTEVERFFRGSIFLTISSNRPSRPKDWHEFASRPYNTALDPDPRSEAIALLAQAIDDEERYRKEYRPSQKAVGKAVASRAIGHLKQSVRSLTGIPSNKLVAAIADAVIDPKDRPIKEDDVKNARTPSKMLAGRRS